MSMGVVLSDEAFSCLKNNVDLSSAMRIVLLAEDISSNKKTYSIKTFMVAAKVSHLNRLDNAIERMNSSEILSIKQEDGDKISVTLKSPFLTIKEKRKKPKIIDKKALEILSKIQKAYHPKRAYTQEDISRRELKKLLKEEEGKEDSLLGFILEDINKQKLSKGWENGRYVPGLGNYFKSRIWKKSVKNAKSNSPATRNTKYNNQLDDLRGLMEANGI